MERCAHGVAEYLRGLPCGVPSFPERVGGGGECDEHDGARRREDAIGDAGVRVLLLNDERDAEERGGETHREGDVPARADDDVWADAEKERDGSDGGPRQRKGEEEVPRREDGAREGRGGDEVERVPRGGDETGLLAVGGPSEVNLGDAVVGERARVGGGDERVRDGDRGENVAARASRGEQHAERRARPKRMRRTRMPRRRRRRRRQRRASARGPARDPARGGERRPTRPSAR